MFLYNLTLYKRSPIWIQEAAIAAVYRLRKTLRESRRFSAICNELDKSQWMTTLELREYQRDRLCKIVQYAAKNVPYYRNTFLKQAVSSEDIQGLKDLSRVPFLTKKDVLEAGTSLLAEGSYGPRFRGATSGTTGLSLTGYRDLEAINYENAFIWRQLQWAGYKAGEPRAWLRGDMFMPVTDRQAPFWRRNRSDNMLILSSFHLSEESVPAYVAALERFDPVLIQAYPSSISYLARYLESTGKSYEGHRLRAVVTSSESITDDQKRVIEKTMGCRVYDWYGSYERVAAIGTCEKGSYHLLSDYSYVELLGRGDGTAELVGTAFYNKVMPLVRYKIGDLIVPASPDYRCACGRSFPVVERIIGRMDDYIITPDGRYIGMMALMFDGLESLLEGQVVQDRNDALRILVVPLRTLSSDEIVNIELRARALVGPDMRITVEPVSEIARTRSGKTRMVVRNI